jgi:hypothetical protein
MGSFDEWMMPYVVPHRSRDKLARVRGCAGCHDSPCGSNRELQCDIYSLSGPVPRVFDTRTSY